MNLTTPYADVLLPLSDEEFEALETSITAEGVLVPVDVTEDGRVLDGHHRLRIDPNAPRRVIPGSNDWSESRCRAHVIQRNWLRRNLSPDQKAELRDTMRQIAQDLNSEDYTDAEIAIMLGVARRTVSVWLSVNGSIQGGTNGIDAISSPLEESGFEDEAETDPAVAHPLRPRRDGRVKLSKEQKADVVSRVQAGESRRAVASHYAVTRRAIDKIIEQAEKRSAIDAERARKAAELDALLKQEGEDRRFVRLGDFREVLADLPDESFPLIFTDPPYDRESVPLYGDLAELGKRILRKGGSLLCYCGQYLLPDIIPLMSKHLDFYWCCACVHTGALAEMREYGIKVAWKPMLWFTNGKRPIHEKQTGFVVDLVTSGGREKDDHDWEQSDVEAIYYIDNLTNPGEWVCDPFAGSGTSLAAAIRIGRSAIGAEIDKEKSAIAEGKVRDAERSTHAGTP